VIGQHQHQAPKLRRVLSSRDLVVYGIILVQPVAALPLFGHVNSLSKGHAVTTILLAMIAMIFTAISYGRMAGTYPSSGSAYTYVGKGLHRYAGFVVGWSMIIDYIFIPILCVIFSSVSSHHLLPSVSYHIWIILFSVAFCYLNLKGIEILSRINLLIIVVMSFMVVYFMLAAIFFVIDEKGVQGLFSSLPFYNPESFSLQTVGSATALAALTFIGFDGLTTLSEEVKNPKRSVMIAAVLTCLITGIWSGAQIYLAQISWPDWRSFSGSDSLDTAIMSVADRIGGKTLDTALAVTLLIGSIGSGISGQIGAGRLLFGMGRDGVIPRDFFGHLDPKSAVPNYNILLIGGLTFTGAFMLNYEECAHLINFGAFFAFMAVNIACMRVCYFNVMPKSIASFAYNFLPPALGFGTCLLIWISLPLKTFIIGGSWLVIGGIYLLVRTRGFRNNLDGKD
jgi:amino acid transporter